MEDEKLSLTRLRIGLLVVWTTIGSAVLADLNPERPAALGWVTMVMITLLCLGGPYRNVRYGIAGVVVALFVVPLALTPTNPVLALDLGMGVLLSVVCGMVLAVAGLLSRSVDLRLGTSSTPSASQVAWATKLAAEMVPEPNVELAERLGTQYTLEGLARDRKPNADHADEQLDKELDRSERFHHEFCLMLLQVEGAPEEEAGRSGTLPTVEQILTRELTPSDTLLPFGNGRFGVIFPEAASDRAAATAERLCRVLTSAVRARCWSGIAEYPLDADNKTDLIAEAEAAMKVASLAQIPVASRLLVA